ncbi:MAG: EAL domain-containing protein [Thermoanaerobaculia bacterium]|nr:EAL domain-containing protein [Thermoanaerobaculia bacterium]
MRPAFYGVAVLLASSFLVVAATRQAHRADRITDRLSAVSTADLSAQRLEAQVAKLVSLTDVALLLSAVDPEERASLIQEQELGGSALATFLTARRGGAVERLEAGRSLLSDWPPPMSSTEVGSLHLAGPSSLVGDDPWVVVWRPSREASSWIGVASRWSGLVEASGLDDLAGHGYEYRLSRKDSGGSTTLSRSATPLWSPLVERSVAIPGGSWELEIGRAAMRSRRAGSVAILGLILSVALSLVVYAAARRPIEWERQWDEESALAAGEREQLLLKLKETQRGSRRLQREFFHDPQSGLPTRAYFMTRLNSSLESLRRDPLRRLSLVLISLEGFRTVAEALRPQEAQSLLAEIAGRVSDGLGLDDLAARLSPDELCVLVLGQRAAEGSKAVLERLQRVLTEPLTVAGTNVYLDPHFGVAHSEQGLEPGPQLLANADLALQRAKRGGPAAVAEYAAAMREDAVTRRLLESDLQTGLQQGELIPFLQPIVELMSGRLAGFEALVRWNRPHEGLVSPVRFLPLAEDTGRIVEIDRVMLRAVCRQVREWLDEGIENPFYISVNLSGRHLVESDLAEFVASTLSEHDVPTERLRLEITESAMIGGFTTALEQTRRLREMGLKLLLDDFGTGYSSLSYLHRFHLDLMKVDASFVREITSPGVHRDIAKTIVDLSRSLGLATVAEGIETEDQRRELLEMGCDYGQGYLFGRPMPVDEARALWLMPS